MSAISSALSFVLTLQVGALVASMLSVALGFWLLRLSARALRDGKSGFLTAGAGAGVLLAGIALFALLIVRGELRKSVDTVQWALADAQESPDMAARKKFLLALEDAAIPLQSEISAQLMAIVDDNEELRWFDENKHRKLLVVTYVNEKTYQRHYSPRDSAPRSGRTPSHRPVIWVTLVPEVAKFCAALKLRGDALALRLHQYFGLPLEARKSHFVELWVDRDRLFRPCPDPETTDTVCGLKMPPDAKIPNTDDYRAFYLSLFEQAYRPNGAPWTRLGYTFDWGGGDSEIGASEFMIAADSPYDIHRAVRTDEYCNR